MAVLEKGDSDAKFGRRVACVVQGAEFSSVKNLYFPEAMSVSISDYQLMCRLRLSLSYWAWRGCTYGKYNGSLSCFQFLDMHSVYVHYVCYNKITLKNHFNGDIIL